jgi:hypothetical protein
MHISENQFQLLTYFLATAKRFKLTSRKDYVYILDEVRYTWHITLASNQVYVPLPRYGLP